MGLPDFTVYALIGSFFPFGTPSPSGDGVRGHGLPVYRTRSAIAPAGVGGAGSVGDGVAARNGFLTAVRPCGLRGGGHGDLLLFDADGIGDESSLCPLVERR